MGKINKYKMIPVTRIIIIISVTIFLCINPFQQKVYALNGAYVALYNDSIAPSGQSGVWQEGITAIKNMLTSKGFTYEEITYKDLNESPQNFSNLYKVILIPGGYASWYNYWISLAGKTRIRNFIDGGGGYFGICAGAYFASGRIVWDGVPYDDNYGYINKYNEPTGYDLDLLSGTGTGSINEIAKYPAYKMTTINFQTENTVLKNYKQIPYTEDMLYYGGPYFTDIGSQVEILGTYSVNGKPAIVAFNYGSGRVVLSGPHPETGGPNWDLAKYILNWLVHPPSCPDLYSWNGSEYLNNGSIYKGSHCPERENFQEMLLTKPVAVWNNTLVFKIVEVDDEISHINSVAMYYRKSGNEWKELDLLYALHTRGSNVTEALNNRDNNRVYTARGDGIWVVYRAPYEGVENAEFKSVSSGYYLWTAETWSQVLDLGPALTVEPGMTVTLQARINNMSAYHIPNATIYFDIQGPDGYSSVKVVSVPAGLASGNPQWHSVNWIVSSDAPAGVYTYSASVYNGEKNITWDVNLPQWSDNKNKVVNVKDIGKIRPTQ